LVNQPIYSLLLLAFADIISLKSAMHINVRDILVESVGYSRIYKISGERPELEGVRIAQDIQGEIQIARLDTSLLVTGLLSTEIELECQRCLRTFTRPIQFKLAQEFAVAPVDDQMLITEDDTIDIALLAEQEIILSTPLKILDRPDCPGIEGAAEKYTKVESISTRISDRARITKGNQHGST
jgi:uncharacterized metal-binding protein YceD (DUF177 family)